MTIDDRLTAALAAEKASEAAGEGRAVSDAVEALIVLVDEIERLPLVAEHLSIKARAAAWCLGDDLDAELSAETTDQRLMAQLVLIAAVTGVQPAPLGLR